MLWIKVFHLFSLIAWFAGIFYLPRLFVYHAMSEDEVGNARFKVMERKLLLGIMTPSAAFTVITGLWLWLGYGFSGSWLMLKLLLVAVVLVYHGWCFYVVKQFREDRNPHSHRFYRVMNELPVVALLGILILVVVKPF